MLYRPSRSLRRCCCLGTPSHFNAGFRFQFCPDNVAAHLRHARVTIPPSARGARERAPVPSGAAACYPARRAGPSHRQRARRWPRRSSHVKPARGPCPQAAADTTSGRRVYQHAPTTLPRAPNCTPSLPRSIPARPEAAVLLPCRECQTRRGASRPASTGALASPRTNPFDPSFSCWIT